jgi:hypothetical protein
MPGNTNSAMVDSAVKTLSADISRLIHLHAHTSEILNFFYAHMRVLGLFTFPFRRKTASN